ncbi:hypothetical protein [Bacteroides congonensis]|uniref:hypothetical protein n=1 Tax=Bacteroides congonensis TaxID=1871006 RepID=UPI003A84E417
MDAGFFYIIGAIYSLVLIAYVFIYPPKNFEEWFVFIGMCCIMTPFIGIPVWVNMKKHPRI